MRTTRGFTMAELMVTVAIIGVLSAIAVPTWRDSQFRTKRAEIPANVAGIRVAELGYYAAWSRFVAQTEPVPRVLAGDGSDRTVYPWPEVGDGGGFDTIGWSPNAAVRGVYSVFLDDPFLEVDGYCNVDGDDEIAWFYATQSVEGIWDPETAHRY